MLQIRQLILREVHLPLRSPFRSSAGTVSRRRLIVVELRMADGLEVWGECAALEAPTYTPETVETAWTVLEDWIGPKLVGRPFTGPRAVGEFLDGIVRGHPMARAAVEMPFWVAEAEHRGLSLAQLLGGGRQRVETGLAVGLEGGIPAVVERCRRAVEEGYKRLRVKVEAGLEVELTAAVRRVVGMEMPLAVDANGCYRLRDEAHCKRLLLLDDFDLSMIEQPLAWDDLADHALLQRRLKTPICLDESVDSPQRARRMIELGSARILNLKPGRVGGLAAALEIHELCRGQGIGLFCGGMLESGIGRAYNVALASLPGFELPGDLSPSRRYWERDLVEPEWTMDRGWVEVPLAAPGLGVRVDRRMIQSVTVRQEVLSSPVL